MVSITYFIKMIALGIYLGAMAYGIPGLATVPMGQNPPGEWETIIENRVFTETLYLDEGDDNTLIINSTFHDIVGSAIMIRDVSNITIKNCTIYNVKEDGIVLRSTGSTRNVTIDGCTIYNTGLNGIITKQNEEARVDHPNLVIKNNTVHDIGKTEYDHGLYIFSTDSLVENNVVYNTVGNGISIRSSGIVRGNKVWDTQGSCIKYYGNHAPGDSNTLYIENNVCHLVEAGAGDPGISIRRGIEATAAWLVQEYHIRFNTVVVRTDERYGFLVESPEIDPKQVELYGNILINTQDISKTVKPQYVDYFSSNYTSASLEGFVNPDQPPYDFQLTADSPARYYASTELRFPSTDINGVVRATSYLDTGAYQFSKPPTADPVAESQDNLPTVTPTQPPKNSEIHIVEDQVEPSVKNLDTSLAIWTGGLNDNLLYFTFPLGLLLVVGVIMLFRIRSGR